MRPALPRIWGVSAGTVREALRQLEGRRVVVRNRNLGTSVVKLSDKEVLETHRSARAP